MIALVAGFALLVGVLEYRAYCRREDARNAELDRSVAMTTRNRSNRNEH